MVYKCHLREQISQNRGLFNVAGKGRMRESGWELKNSKWKSRPNFLTGMGINQ